MAFAIRSNAILCFIACFLSIRIISGRAFDVPFELPDKAYYTVNPSNEARGANHILNEYARGLKDGTLELVDESSEESDLSLLEPEDLDASKLKWATEISLLKCTPDDLHFFAELLRKIGDKKHDYMRLLKDRVTHVIDKCLEQFQYEVKQLVDKKFAFDDLSVVKFARLNVAREGPVDKPKLWEFVPEANLNAGLGVYVYVRDNLEKKKLEKSSDYKRRFARALRRKLVMPCRRFTSLLREKWAEFGHYMMIYQDLASVVEDETLESMSSYKVCQAILREQYDIAEINEALEGFIKDNRKSLKIE